MLNMAPCVRTQPGNDSAKSLLPQGTAPTVPLMFQPLVSFRKVRFTARPAFRAGVNAENLRSYSFGVFRLVTSVPQGANPASLQEHFAPLSQLSFVHKRTPPTHRRLDTPGWLPDLGRENREKSLPYFEYQFLSSASIDQQALKALYGFLAFLIAPGQGAFTGLSSQRGLRLLRRYP